jgi:type IV pilus assembly protein PilY1
MTDGQANYDDDWTTLTTVVGDYDGDGEEATTANRYLDDVAEFLYDNDLRTDMDGVQNIVTHTVAFALTDGNARALVENAGIKGGGTYQTADNYDQLKYALERIIGEILEVSSSYTAPVVPISHMEKATSGSDLYVALFKPALNAFWKGNIKKYSLDDNGHVIDALGNPATDSMGMILGTSQSYWSAAPDGGETDSGGVGQLLLGRATPREIYTYTRIDKPFRHPHNAFTKSNDKLTKELFQVATDAEKDQIIDFVYGYDVYDEDGDGDTTEHREWILGSILHSRPTVINYSDTLRVIYVGANDGMLHAFLDSDGSELWGFVPTDLYGNLQQLHSSELHYFADGSPRAVVIDKNNDGVIRKNPDNDQAFLIFGERRGGDTYYAIDVTDPYDPEIMWMIEGGDPGFEELGQSWSTPQVGVLETGELAAIFGAGYDPDRDLGNASDDIGRGVFIVNAETGQLIWKWTNAEDPTMTASIPSDVVVLDSNNNGKIDRLYAGDLNGDLRRFQIRDSTGTMLWNGWKVFSAGARKIFYPPDILEEQDHVVLIWGTGDRTDPNRRNIENRIYMFKDMDDMTAYDESALVDLTVNVLDDPSAAQADKDQVLADLSNSKGWYIRLENSGEKALSGIITLFASHATTFTPTNVEGDPCSFGEGVARLYVVNYRHGTAVRNLDESVGGSLDRSFVIGTSIPSGVQIAILRGKLAGFVGVSGGVYQADVGTIIPILRIYWRQK